MGAEAPRAFVDIEVVTEGRSAPRDALRRNHEDRVSWRELRTVRLDGRAYAVPADFPVVVETKAGGPQLVTITFFAGDVRFTPKGEESSP